MLRYMLYAVLFLVFASVPARAGLSEKVEMLVKLLGKEQILESVVEGDPYSRITITYDTANKEKRLVVEFYDCYPVELQPDDATCQRPVFTKYELDGLTRGITNTITIFDRKDSALWDRMYDFRDAHLKAESECESILDLAIDDLQKKVASQ